MRGLYSPSQNVNQVLLNDISHTFHIPLAFFFSCFRQCEIWAGSEFDEGIHHSFLPTSLPHLIATKMVAVDGNNTDKNSRHSCNKTQQVCIQKTK
jgi:hypothetical protein